MACKSKRKDGKPCKMPTGASGYCYAHDPARAEQRAESHHAGGVARQAPDDPDDNEWDALEGNPCDHPEAIETALAHVSYRVATGKLTPAAGRVITAALSKTADLLLARFQRHISKYRSEPWSAWMEMERERAAAAADGDDNGEKE